MMQEICIDFIVFYEVMNSFIPFIDLRVCFEYEVLHVLGGLSFFFLLKSFSNNSNQNHSSSVLISFYIGFEYYSMIWKLSEPAFTQLFLTVVGIMNH